MQRSETVGTCSSNDQVSLSVPSCSILDEFFSAEQEKKCKYSKDSPELPLTTRAKFISSQTHKDFTNELFFICKDSLDTNKMFFFVFFVFSAHSSRSRRRRPIPGVPRLLPGGFPCDAVHRVQRRQGHVSLLCQQAQLLAHLHRSVFPRRAGIRDAQSGPAPVAHQPLPSLHEELVKGDSLCNFWPQSSYTQ